MSTPTEERTYHHGDLNNQLRHVAAEVIAERGAAGFSLREVARRAGVSHAAPAHHFGDATGLLTSVALDAFHHMREAVSAAGAGIDDPVERLSAMSRAYVEVSESNPGACAVVFRHDLVHADDPAYRQAAQLAHDTFRSVIAEIAEVVNPELDVDNATRLGWAALQGLIQLHPNMVALAQDSDTAIPERGELAEIFTRMLVDGMRESR